MLSRLRYFFLFFLTVEVMANIEGGKGPRYQTSFGKCPSKTTGRLALKLIKVFEGNFSLKDIKRTIVDERLREKYFLSRYQINYSPLRKLVKFNFDCPTPLMKAQIYRANGTSGHEALLVENGELYDPVYELFLQREKKLKGTLPFLALPAKDIGLKRRREMAQLVKKMGDYLSTKLAEVILSVEGKLTIILSIGGSPSSVFLGKENWGEKIEKMGKIVRYMEKKNHIPATINITDIRKILVKFNDKF